MHYYAHSTAKKDMSDWQSLEEHLYPVAQQAEEFARAFGVRHWGYVCGLLHDVGKATPEFLRRLGGEKIQARHSIHGARQAWARYGAPGLLVAYVIAGHHGGLPDGGEQERQLHYRLGHERVPAADTDFINALLDSVPQKLCLPFPFPREEAGFVLAFFTRMLFSCLVDADFLDTEKFCDRNFLQFLNS